MLLPSTNRTAMRSVPSDSPHAWDLLEHTLSVPAAKESACLLPSDKLEMFCNVSFILKLSVGGKVLLTVRFTLL